MNTLSRRRFVGTSAGLAGGLALALNPRAQGSNERVRLAIVGLGGRDITKDSIKEIFSLMTGKEKAAEFIDLKPELLKERYE